MRLILFLAAMTLVASPAVAQSSRPAYRAGAAATDTNPAPTQCRDWNPVTAAWTSCVRQESFQLAAANTPATPATVYGGDYILTQACTSYGTLTLQARGPDGSSWTTLLTKTASDPGGGTGLALGSYAVVRVTVSGTAGCNAVLARVPA